MPGRYSLESTDQAIHVTGRAPNIYACIPIALLNAELKTLTSFHFRISGRHPPALDALIVIICMHA